MDISQAQCGCVTAMYLIKAPAIDVNGDYDITNGFYYCDSTAVDGQHCPDFDIMEANAYAFQTSSNPCYTEIDGHYTDDCLHDVICHKNTVELFNHQGIDNYGPGEQYQINTLKDFHVKIDFQEENGQFQKFTTLLTQGSNTVTIACNDEMLNAETDVLNDMTLTFSSWGSPDANWLW